MLICRDSSTVRLTAQGRAHSRHHDAHDERSVFAGDFREHHTNHRAVFVPADHVGLPRRFRERRHDVAEDFLTMVGGLAVARVKQHEQERFPGTLASLAFKRNHPLEGPLIEHMGMTSSR